MLNYQLGNLGLGIMPFLALQELSSPRLNNMIADSLEGEKLREKETTKSEQARLEPGTLKFVHQLSFFSRPPA